MACLCLQQFLEKYLKAAFVKKFEKVPPYTHSLLKLCKELAVPLSEEMLEAITRIDKYYLAARYPDYKASLNISNRKDGEQFFNKAKEIFEWLKQKLPV